MPVLAFTGSSARDDDNQFGETARLVNCYIEPGDTREFLKPVLGTVLFADIDDVFLQAMRVVRDDLYAACGGRLYRVNAAGSIEDMGAIANGQTTISGNNEQVAIAANGQYFVLENGVITSPVTGALSDPPAEVGSVTFVGQFTIISEKNGRRFNWSAVADATSFDALDFASAESRDDDIVRVMGINGYLVIFKEGSREVWYQTGAADSALAFTRMTGAVSETGLKGFNLLAEIDSGAFFVGDDNIVYLTDGQNQRAISNRAVETSVKGGTAQRCFFYEDEGHKIAVITFSDRPAWCYDFATEKWHERELGQSGIWPVVESVKFNGEWYVGTDLGAISRLERVQFDGGEPLRKRAVSRTLYNDGQRFRVPELEMFANAGRAGEDCWIRLSGDNGNTWGGQKVRSLGGVGDYDLRATWRSLGQFRRLTAELNWSGDQTFANEARVRLA